MGDTLDDAMATEDSEEEEALIVQQVLDELGKEKILPRNLITINDCYYYCYNISILVPLECFLSW